jgi:hypothetical protein
MSNHTTLTVPKDRQDVTVHLLDGVELEGAIFLEYAPTAPTIHQKVIAFLEDGNAFFPLRLSESGATEFINKINVSVVELAYTAEEEKDSLALSLMHSVNITAIFTNENTISGALLAEVPVEKTRLSDCLNLPQKFLSVKLDGKICYINKNALQKVIYADKA